MLVRMLVNQHQQHKLELILTKKNTATATLAKPKEQIQTQKKGMCDDVASKVEPNLMRWSSVKVWSISGIQRFPFGVFGVWIQMNVKLYDE